MSFNNDWITGKKTMGTDMVEWANDFGKELEKKKLTTSQIRKFFGEVKRIQADWDRYKEDVPILNAKLAYAVGRSNGAGIEKFAKTFKKPIFLASESEAYFNRLVKILEATVAYHKYHGGRD